MPSSRRSGALDAEKLVIILFNAAYAQITSLALSPPIPARVLSISSFSLAFHQRKQKEASEGEKAMGKGKTEEPFSLALAEIECNCNLSTIENTEPEIMVGTWL